MIAFLRTGYNQGIILNNPEDAANLARLLAKCQPVQSTGYNADTVFTPDKAVAIPSLEFFDDSCKQGAQTEVAQPEAASIAPISAEISVAAQAQEQRQAI